MIYSVNFMDLTEKINPHAVVRYLKDTGWMQYKTKKEYIKIFQKITEKEEFYQEKYLITYFLHMPILLTILDIYHIKY